MPLWLAIILIVVFAAVAFFSGITYRKKVSEREISSAEEEARRIINEAIKTGESKQREALLEAKESIPWAARRSNQSILKEINSEYSLEGLMLELKRQSFGHLMRRADSLEKTLILGKTEGKRRRYLCLCFCTRKLRLSGLGARTWRCKG